MAMSITARPPHYPTDLLNFKVMHSSNLLENCVLLGHALLDFFWKCVVLVAHKFMMSG